MRILFFGRYDPEYSRNRVLLKGLRMNGIHVSECRVSPSARFWPVLLLFRYTLSIIRYTPFDIVLVPFPGQEVMLLARWLTRKPIVFDAFTSHYEGYVLDRRIVRPGSVRARWHWFLDRWSCRLADAVLTDTQAHVEWFANEFHVPRSKLRTILVGTDTDVFRPVGSEPSGAFTVHFHGTNIPLQGIPVILRAADLLKHTGILFTLIGVRGDRVPYGQLPAAMARAHLCLGIFGDTEKTQRVIPNKVFEALAVGRPVITADTPAIRELLDERSAVLIPPADPQALADAILKLKSDPELRRRIGEAGRAVLLARATPDILGRQVADIMRDLR